MFNSTAPTDSVITLEVNQTRIITQTHLEFGVHSVEVIVELVHIKVMVCMTRAYINTGLSQFYSWLKNIPLGFKDWAIIDAAKNPNTVHSQTIVWGNGFTEQNNGINRLRFTSTKYTSDVVDLKTGQLRCKKSKHCTLSNYCLGKFKFSRTK